MSHDTSSPPGPQPAQAPRTPLAWLRQWLGRQLARYLSREPPSAPTAQALSELERVRACLRPGDVILVEGRSRFSTGIKYLTQSTWSHSALYFGEAALAGRTDRPGACIVEADLVEGVRAVGLETYAGLPLRICRPVSLGPEEVQVVVTHALARLGHRYDLKHILDLVRWLLPAPPIPARFRRRLLTLGSGDPTRAICSMLVAEALQAVRYPILPQVRKLPHAEQPDDDARASEVLQLRHASLFVPRDFDLSPYFEIVKPPLALGFDHRRLVWSDDYVDPDKQEAGDGAARPARASTRRPVGDVIDVVERAAAPDPARPAAARSWFGLRRRR